MKDIIIKNKKSSNKFNKLIHLKENKVLDKIIKKKIIMNIMKIQISILTQTQIYSKKKKDDYLRTQNNDLKAIYIRNEISEIDYEILVSKDKWIDVASPAQKAALNVANVDSSNDN